MFKEPAFFINGTSISVYNIGQRIQLKQNFEIGIIFEHPDVPKDRSRPHSHLQSNIDNLCQIAKKYHNCTGAAAS